jgi:RND family efflux transporter MFP subunit
MRRVPIPALAAPAVALLALAACQGAPPPPAANSTPIGAAVVVDGPDAPTLELHGVVGSRDELRLAFKAGGVVAHIGVEPGDSVRAGAVLAELEPPEVDALLSQARELEQKAARDLARGEQLRADEVISLEQLQNLRTQHEVAAAQLRAASFNRGHARIVAPADGVVLQRLVSAHELVAPGQPVLAVSSGKRGWVLRAAVSDRELLALREGLAATVRLDAAPGEALRAHVVELSRAADPATGLFPVQLALEPTKLRLASGMVASATLEPGTGGRRVRIPAGALVSAAGTEGHVFVLENGIARARTVHVAFLDGNRIALGDGLAAGETVVTDGAAFLEDGEKVAVAPTTAPVAPTTPAAAPATR